MKQTDQIKNAIVKGYKRGVCTADGCDIALEKRGRNGKGSHFRPAKSKEWYEHFDQIDFSSCKGKWTKKGRKSVMVIA